MARGPPGRWATTWPRPSLGSFDRDLASASLPPWPKQHDAAAHVMTRARSAAVPRLCCTPHHGTKHGRSRCPRATPAGATRQRGMPHLRCTSGEQPIRPPPAPRPLTSSAKLSAAAMSSIRIPLLRRPRRPCSPVPRATAGRLASSRRLQLWLVTGSRLARGFLSPALLQAWRLASSTLLLPAPLRVCSSVLLFDPAPRLSTAHSRACPRRLRCTAGTRRHDGLRWAARAVRARLVTRALLPSGRLLLGDCTPKRTHGKRDMASRHGARGTHGASPAVVVTGAVTRRSI